MRIKPGEVYQVDLGLGGKVRYMVAVSKDDPDAPRALTICVPITTAYRGSVYEVCIGKPRFLQELSYANVQGLQAVQHHECSARIGTLDQATMNKIKAALKYALELE